MRDALSLFTRGGVLPRDTHVGLAYETLAPTAHGVRVDVKNRGKIPDDDREAWLRERESLRISAHYDQAFARWHSSFSKPGDCTARLTTSSRLLVGHGNPSAVDVGLTVHHTWGVPMIPGSALKGLLAHYVDAVYGPESHAEGPHLRPDDHHARFAGVVRDERDRPKYGPGVWYRALFGAPDALADREMLAASHPAGAATGLVQFHDALYIPPPIGQERKPFAVDVLTVHQKQYYDAPAHADSPNGEEPPWPNDYDDPNPVAFLTVRPQTQLLLALSGPKAWTDLAGELLTEALREWGVGGKTSSGYGIGIVDRWRSAELPASAMGQRLQDFLAFLAAPPAELDTHRLLFEEIRNHWSDLTTLPEQERQRAAEHIRKRIKPNAKKKQFVEDFNAFMASLATGAGEGA